MEINGHNTRETGSEKTGCYHSKSMAISFEKNNHRENILKAINSHTFKTRRMDSPGGDVMSGVLSSF